jgi:uncharacterized phiE125 gp8 family phage protein
MAEPLTTAELKAHLRKTTTDEDSLIAAYGIAAREWVENYTGHILNQRAVTDSFGEWGDYLTLYHQPITVGDPTPTLTVEYTDDEGDFIEYEARVVRDFKYPWTIHPPYGFSFPSLGGPASITVTYTAGYANAAAVPETFKQAIRLLVTSMYTNRGTLDAETERAVRFMLRSYRGAVMA